MEKEFKTIEEQISILKKRRLKINNETNAKEMLIKNNYYYLINGYKELFLDRNKCNVFNKESKIEEIYSLCEFDRKMRIKFLEYILIIENRLNSYIAYEFSKNYGHKDYLIPENFNNTIKNKELIINFIKDINLEISHQYKNSNKMIVHYLDKYHYIPLWVLIRILSFGKMSKFYSLMKQREKNNISKKFNIPSQVLRTYLINLGNVRNICAHDEKLYDIRLKNRINITEYHKKLNINISNSNIMYSTRDLFSIVIILKILLEDEEFYDFYNNIIININWLENKLISININNVLNKMGFPSNYQDILKI